MGACLRIKVIPKRSGVARPLGRTKLSRLARPGVVGPLSIRMGLDPRRVSILLYRVLSPLSSLSGSKPVSLLPAQMCSRSSSMLLMAYRSCVLLRVRNVPPI